MCVSCLCVCGYVVGECSVCVMCLCVECGFIMCVACGAHVVCLRVVCFCDK